MTKRQMPDLSRLLSVTATPMPDAAEQSPTLRPVPGDIPASPATAAQLPVMPQRSPRTAPADETATANLENLNFKVPKSFRKRFRDCAYRADLKHNELLFAALDAWETLHGEKN